MYVAEGSVLHRTYMICACSAHKQRQVETKHLSESVMHSTGLVREGWEPE